MQMSVGAYINRLEGGGGSGICVQASGLFSRREDGVGGVEGFRFANCFLSKLKTTEGKNLCHSKPSC